MGDCRCAPIWRCPSSFFTRVLLTRQYPRYLRHPSHISPQPLFCRDGRHGSVPLALVVRTCCGIPKRRQLGLAPCDSDSDFLGNNLSGPAARGAPGWRVRCCGCGRHSVRQPPPARSTAVPLGLTIPAGAPIATGAPFCSRLVQLRTACAPGPRASLVQRAPRCAAAPHLLRAAAARPQGVSSSNNRRKSPRKGFPRSII